MLFAKFWHALIFGFIQFSFISLFIIAYIDILGVDKKINDRNMKSPN